jgi:AmpD protein
VRLDAEGWLSGVQHRLSPNYDGRPPATRIELLVIHNISLPPGEFGGDAVIQLFTNSLDVNTHPYYAELEGLKVSAHFFVRRNGDIVQFVPCSRRAWHAGLSRWRGRERCNDFSIGIELEGTDAEVFTERQYISLAKLTRKLCRAYPIREIVGHSDIAPERKTDPGPHFDWPQYFAKLK